MVRVNLDFSTTSQANTVNKKNESLDTYLEKLEFEATNELQEFAVLCPSYYSTDHLLDLRRQWLGEMQLFKQMQKMNLIIGACSPVWLGIGVLFATLNMQILTVVSFCLFSVFLFTFVVAAFVVKKKFKNRTHLEKIGESLNQELYLRGIRVQRFDYKKNG